MSTVQHRLPLSKLRFTTPLIKDYLEQHPDLKPFYHRFPKIESFKAQLEEKGANYTVSREELVSVIRNQYKKITISSETDVHIELLKKPTAFTITTGHQLNLFSGPLYFWYKIISTLNLCNELKKAYPSHDFIPVYWMASEDHDFDEINYFNFKGKKIRWHKESNGPVGRLKTDGLQELSKLLHLEFGLGQHAERLSSLFEQAYAQNETLVDATRYLVNELFKEEGLVIVDGDDVSLKKHFIPFIKEELSQNTSHKKVEETIQGLSNYKIQVNPREINLFYMEDDFRERIVEEKGVYSVLNTSIRFTQNEILEEVAQHPEKFSPNVLLRPLYQEVVLPNLCYIGGGGELAYWLELKSYFESQRVTFPILMHRDMALVMTDKQLRKAQKLELSPEDLFLDTTTLTKLKTQQLSSLQLDFSELKTTLENQFKTLTQLASQTDPTFMGALQAQQTKQIKGLNALEKRLLKAEKKRHHEVLLRITQLQQELFPGGGLQERITNFSELYLEYGEGFKSKLLEELNPLELEVKVMIF
ncbi:MAG: bacillithiol biosynthesis cysteine-adding enzyme BshC [Flavobacterium sp.]